LAGAIFGEVQLSLFVAGAIFGENFSIQKARAEDEKNLSCAAGCGLKGLCSDHDRIGPALHMTFQPFSENFLDILACHFCGTRNVW